MDKKSEFRDDKNKIKISPVNLIPLSFLFTILIGTALLMIPIATAEGEKTSLLTALFTATTSTCVTGLVVVDTYAHWSVFGQLIMLILVQIGGLGVVTVASMIMLLGRKKFTLGDRLLLGDSMNVEKNRGLLGFLVRVFRGVFITEGIGALLYAVKFVPQYGFLKGMWASIFQSISAFCNAGMDILGPNSMIDFRESYYIMFVTMMLIVVGGLGFVVWFDLVDGIKDGIKKHFSFGRIISRLSEHTKLVLMITFILLIFGTVFIFVAEYNNPETMAGMSLGQKLLNSLFQSVTLRTAGFASVPQAGLTEASCVIGHVLMFIGGSPVGTAGGIKTVTAFLVFMNALSYIRGRNETVVFRKKVSTELMRKASAVVFVSLITIFVMTLLLLSRGGITLNDASYEVVSALGTVGLSRNLTPNLDAGGKLIIIVSMFLGRIGPISMALFFTNKKQLSNRVRYSEGKFYVG